MIYANVIKNKVNLIEIEPEKVQELIDLGLDIRDISNLNPQPQPGWLVDGEVFSPPEEPEKQTLSVTADKEVILANDADESVIIVRHEINGVLTSAADGMEWFIPVMNIDGNQADLLSVILVDGLGTLKFKTSNKGIYTIRIDLIRPVPSAVLQDNVEIIAR